VIDCRKQTPRFVVELRPAKLSTNFVPGAWVVMKKPSIIESAHS
jgi:hypothetical protein